MIDRRRAPARTIRSVTFATVATLLLLLLRAKSDGETPPPVVVAALFAATAVSAWQLSRRERGALALIGALFVAQLLLHVGYLYAATGQFAHPGSTGLFCSPRSITDSSCSITDRGGMVLLAVQLTVALTLAIVLRGAEAACWQLIRRPVRAIVAVVWRAFQFVVRLARPALTTASMVAVVSQDETPRPRRLLWSHEHGRRGPPLRWASDSLAAAPSFS